MKLLDLTVRYNDNNNCFELDLTDSHGEFQTTHIRKGNSVTFDVPIKMVTNGDAKTHTLSGSFIFKEPSPECNSETVQYYGTTTINETWKWIYSEGFWKYMQTHTEKDMEVESLKPIKIIYNNPYTICFFPDGTKEIVKCKEGETYYKESGVLHCIAKKMFKSRKEFLRLIESGKEQKNDR